MTSDTEQNKVCQEWSKVDSYFSIEGRKQSREGLVTSQFYSTINQDVQPINLYKYFQMRQDYTQLLCSLLNVSASFEPSSVD